MSAADSLCAQDVTGVLAALWDARGQNVPVRELLRLTGISLPRAQTALETLTTRGCRIERTPAGLSLATVSISSWRELIVMLARQRGWRLGRDALVFPETGSTNDAAWQAAGTEETDGLVVLADHQTAGRGRLGRTWQARPSQSVLLSILLRQIPAEAMDRLTLLAGLATAVALEQAIRLASGAMGRIEIKWPNDLLIRQRKVSGILVETRKLNGPRGVIDAVVVGIGINAAQGAGDFPAELAERSISLFQASGLLLDRMRIIEAVLTSLDHFLKSDDHEAWMGQWKERCGMLGRRLSFHMGHRVITGQVLDVAPMQGLIVRDDQGSTHFLSARTCSVG